MLTVYNKASNVFSATQLQPSSSMSCSFSLVIVVCFNFSSLTFLLAIFKRGQFAPKHGRLICYANATLLCSEIYSVVSSTSGCELQFTSAARTCTQIHVNTYVQKHLKCLWQKTNIISQCLCCTKAVINTYLKHVVYSKNGCVVVLRPRLRRLHL